jgi:transcriptional regulator with XRE-family HTH domain
VCRAHGSCDTLSCVDSAHETYSPRTSGAWLRELRHAGRWSQAALAAEMSDRGFPWHATTVARTEKGQRRVDIDEARALADIFSVPLESIGQAA